MRNLLSLILITVLAAGCKNDETLITGEITGYVNCVDPFYKQYPLEATAVADLMKDTLVIATQQTGEYGKFNFSNIPYGKYNIRAIKSGYVQPWLQEQVFHAGGATPTFFKISLYEVPTFQLVFDSINFSSDYFSYLMYMHFSDPDVKSIPFSGFSFFAFFSDQPTVDRFTFVATVKETGITRDENADGQTDFITGNIAYSGINFDTMPGQLYVRLYAVAYGQGFYPAEVVPGAYGPPSDVFEFKNPWAAR